MTDDRPNTALWRFFDGAASVSASMSLSVAVNACAFCNGLPVLGYLEELTNRDDGIIITATLLPFPNHHRALRSFQNDLRSQTSRRTQSPRTRT